MFYEVRIDAVSFSIFESILLVEFVAQPNKNQMKPHKTK